MRFTEALAWELKTSKIDINAVAPGTLNTRLLDELLAAGPQVVDATLSGRSLDAQRAGAPLQPTVDLITFLASTKSDGISGRLISAIWNDWQNVPDRMTELEDSDLFTLRHYLWSVISGLYRKYLIEQLSPRFQSGTDVPLPVR